MLALPLTLQIARRLIVFLFVVFSVSYTTEASIQKPGLQQTPQAAERAAAIKTAFLEAYNDYLRYGYPSDEGQFAKSFYRSIISACSH